MLGVDMGGTRLMLGVIQRWSTVTSLHPVKIGQDTQTMSCLSSHFFWCSEVMCFYSFCSHATQKSHTSLSTVVHFRDYKRSDVFFCVLTSPSRSHRAKCVPCGPDLRGVRLVGGAYPFPNLPPLLSHRELCPGTAPAHLPAPPQRLPA